MARISTVRARRGGADTGPALDTALGRRAGEAGQAAHDLDGLIHERVRLGIVSALATR